ncbi:FAD-dependent monooxygenase [Larkinella knui]|uniref:FAD-binding monooxygenase n=1 Tax=Larkinella knui TaxID=2025310 RepID=A0A3P1CPB3_9BACT|nr:FAD-dependent monooxygenase [Larkinella knui]RRB14896.1 FAD-binding monooxygenase [Larkinella knui]
MTTSRKALIIGCGIAGPVVALFLQQVGIDAEIYESQPAGRDEAGAFLNLAPNGVNVLKALDIDHLLAADGFHSVGMDFFNGDGKLLAQLESSDEEERFGSRNVMIKRGRLQQVLRDEAIRRNIPVQYGKKLTGIQLNGFQNITARFEDGTSAEGNFLIGCDGIHSRTRQLILPNAPRPAYTGMVDCGGFAQCPAGLSTSGAMQMIFGKKAFFGYIAKPDGEVYWFSNVPWPKEPKRHELNAISADAWRQQLLHNHGNDPAPVPEIIESTPGEIGKWPVYDMPSLPTWHKGLVCLVGDAAHATSPHSGQGASLALEDAAVLAQCLRDSLKVEHGFAKFESLRRERVEKIVKQARRTGNGKMVTNPVAVWFRDLVLPFFIKQGAKASEEVLSYKVDWEKEVA